jgi:hypothetical protein
MKKSGVKSHASVANRNVESVAQTGLYQLSSKPVNELRLTALKATIRNEIQSLATRLTACDDRNQPRPSTALKTARTPASSIIQSKGCRRSLTMAGSYTA